jgi:two-component system, NtrC family, nitrogen regulation response regulator GlnG
MSDNSMQFLASLELPGNVRQLENLCNWITVMAPGQTVEVKDMPQDLIGGESFAQFGAPSATGTMSGTTSAPANVPSLAEALRPSDVAGLRAPLMSGPAIPATSLNGNGAHDKMSWIALLESEAEHMLSSGQPEVMDALGRQFESALIKTALKYTHGRKNDAAVRLGIGRNTITRKIQELGIDGAKED